MPWKCRWYNSISVIDSPVSSQAPIYCNLEGIFFNSLTPRVSSHSAPWSFRPQSLRPNQKSVRSIIKVNLFHSNVTSLHDNLIVYLLTRLYWPNWCNCFCKLDMFIILFVSHALGNLSLSVDAFVVIALVDWWPIDFKNRNPVGYKLHVQTFMAKLSVIESKYLCLIMHVGLYSLVSILDYI